jgi:hypothetical protein
MVDIILKHVTIVSENDLFGDTSGGTERYDEYLNEG